MVDAARAHRSDHRWRDALANPDRAARYVAAVSLEHPEPALNARIIERMRPIVQGAMPPEHLGTMDPERWQRNLSTYEASGMVSRAPSLFLPTMPIGKSNEHFAIPGTLTLSAETLMRLWMEIGASVARAGVRKLVFFNGHGGNAAAMDIVARDRRTRHGLLTASCSWYSPFDSTDLFDKRELVDGVHAREGETSVMLAARGHLVDMSLARDFSSRSERWADEHHDFGVGSTPVKLGWLIQDLNRDGACGNAAAADAAKGERLLEHGVERFIAMLREFDRLSEEDLDAFPD